MSAIPGLAARPKTDDDAAESDELYESRKQIYPQSVSGTFRNIKWALLVVGMLIYYFLPFVRWDRGPEQPTQAVLVDLAHEKFFFFGIEIWPQEVYYITGLLILASFTLFLMNAVAGRIWCGYLCPQTVWTDLFMLIERWTQGDRRDRLRKAKQPASLETVVEAILKHSLWLMIAWWTGGAWVLYFADAPTLVKQLATFQAPAQAYIWICILTASTYTLAGFAREQICIYMCPWPRIQAALTDEWALNVTYRTDRGEPRGKLKKNKALRAAGQKAGDCVDCGQCVAVCPTGVDIRGGLNMGCIQCGLCIDACDNVMTKLKLPTGLIGYDTDENIRRREIGLDALKPKIVRARTILYAGLIVLVSGVMGFALLTRQTLNVDVIHDRNPIYIALSDGSIRNAYTIRALNQGGSTRPFRLSLEGLPAAKLDILGQQTDGDGALITVSADQTLELRVIVTTPPGAVVPPTTPVKFVLTDLKTNEAARRADFFKGP